jgi:uncharacterized membrane protein YphA (DoxX/SURF4 family)
MIYAIIGVSTIFIGIAYLLTEDNASQILSGYNTMSKESQKKFNLKTFIPFFKKFHISLGVSCLVIGLLLNLSIDEKVAAVFVTLYTIAAYIYFIEKSNSFSEGNNKASNKIAQIVLIGVLIFLIIIFITKGF